jgi:hypothetical protein
VTTSEDKRAAHIASLRALADLLECEPSLPLPYCMDGTGYASGVTSDKSEQVAAVFAAAKLFGTQVEYDRINGTLRAVLLRGNVRYCVYAKVDSRPFPDDKVIVTDPSQVFVAEAVTQR